jgi:hypothetical protein
MKVNTIEIIKEMMRKAQIVGEHLSSAGFTTQDASCFAVCFLAYQKAKYPKLFKIALKVIDEIANIYSVEEGEEDEK